MKTTWGGPLSDSDSPERSRQVAKFVLFFLYNVDRGIIFSPYNAIPDNYGVVDLQKCVRQISPARMHEDIEIIMVNCLPLVHLCTRPQGTRITASCSS